MNDLDTGQCCMKSHVITVYEKDYDSCRCLLVFEKVHLVGACLLEQRIIEAGARAELQW